MVINSLLVSKSDRQNDIPIHILKPCKNSLSPFLVQICNLCIREGTYPQGLKCAQVVPIYKGGPNDLCTNYRPISLLSPINKIFEKLIYSRLYTYLEQNSKLSSHQYGLRMGLSTTLAIYDMQENMENLEKGFITCTIFCDLSKAFDTIDHDVLLWKLNNFFGIRGLPPKLLASYLQGRQQYTVIDDCTSATLNITPGVPQGSSFGPWLFALYINDLPSTTKLTPTLFSDDTVLSISGSNSTELQSIVNTELEKVNEWLHFNKLSLTIRKPHT